MTKPAIRIACRGATTADIAELREFQGNLKSLSERDYEKLKAMILDRGFSFPIAVWLRDSSKFILDGHQRLRVLRQLREDGYDIPPVPVDVIEAETFKEAKTKLLAAASQFGKVEGDGLYEFLTEADLEVDEVIESMRLPEIDMGFFKEEFYGDSSWDTDLDSKSKIDKIEANLDGIIATIKVNCPQEQKDAVTAVIREAISGFDGVELA